MFLQNWHFVRLNAPASARPMPPHAAALAHRSAANAVPLLFRICTEWAANMLGVGSERARKGLRTSPFPTRLSALSVARPESSPKPAGASISRGRSRQVLKQFPSLFCKNSNKKRSFPDKYLAIQSKPIIFDPVKKKDMKQTALHHHFHHVFPNE